MNREKLSNIIKRTIRKLRQNQTKSEKIVWECMRNRRILGRKFLRQYPIIFEWNGKNRFLIADFYCHEAGLVVEIDGPIHERQIDYDRARDYAVKCLGIKVLRMKNNMVINQTSKAIDQIKEAVKSSFQDPSLIKRGGRG